MILWFRDSVCSPQSCKSWGLSLRRGERERPEVGHGLYHPQTVFSMELPYVGNQQEVCVFEGHGERRDGERTEQPDQPFQSKQHLPHVLSHMVGSPFLFTPAEVVVTCVDTVECYPPKLCCWKSSSEWLEFLLACWLPSPLCCVQLNHMLLDTNGDTNELINIYW